MALSLFHLNSLAQKTISPLSRIQGPLLFRRRYRDLLSLSFALCPILVLCCVLKFSFPKPSPPSRNLSLSCLVHNDTSANNSQRPLLSHHLKVVIHPYCQLSLLRCSGYFNPKVLTFRTIFFVLPQPAQLPASHPPPLVHRPRLRKQLALGVISYHRLWMN